MFIFSSPILLASSGKLKEASEPNSEVAAAFSTIRYIIYSGYFIKKYKESMN